MCLVNHQRAPQTSMLTDPIRSPRRPPWPALTFLITSTALQIIRGPIKRRRWLPLTPHPLTSYLTSWDPFGVPLDLWDPLDVPLFFKHLDQNQLSSRGPVKAIWSCLVFLSPEKNLIVITLFSNPLAWPWTLKYIICRSLPFFQLFKANI